MREVECGFGDANGIQGSQILINCGPIIDVQIGYDPNFDINKIHISGLPKLGQKKYRALIDTGATGSSIDKDLANSMGLHIVDKGSMIVGSGVQEFDRYLAQIYVPSLGWGEHGFFMEYI
ncbi:MAG: hypothetical protein F4120_11040 [Rhodothermaceae bacterium]|nr:hypothetical protein [Rhodothermaceae bacterium]MXW33447.1 hypothetical protein [Rhodothermaceae bacterium]MXZ18757.1 hypothetical protein [Rhodothermaceae bacterium]MYC05522.1 hypothetical protein [Rhodothermaceae bacterium]MYE62482.1 hypothetical protein [Rhodothermaceae bacterium]